MNQAALREGGAPPPDPAKSAAKPSPGFRTPSTPAQLIESRLYTYCLSGRLVMGTALMTAIRCTVQKALADYFCLDIQGRALGAEWLGTSAWPVHRYSYLRPGMPWLVVRNTGYEPAAIRPPLLGYLAGGAEEVINPKPAAMAKSRVWPYLRKNGWEAASELLALNEILARSSLEIDGRIT